MRSNTHDSFEYYKIFKIWFDQCDQEEPDIIENEKVINILTDFVWAFPGQDLPFREDAIEEKSGNFCQIMSLVSRYSQLLLSGKKTLEFDLLVLKMNLLKYWETIFDQKLSNELKTQKCVVFQQLHLDVLHKDKITTICIYVEEAGHPREKFLSLKTVTSKTGEATAVYIIETLRSNSLDTEKSIVWLHVNSMSGHLGGAKRKSYDKLDISYIKYKYLIQDVNISYVKVTVITILLDILLTEVQ